jgi:hypothetical protein
VSKGDGGLKLNKQDKPVVLVLGTGWGAHAAVKVCSPPPATPRAQLWLCSWLGVERAAHLLGGVCAAGAGRSQAANQCLKTFTHNPMVAQVIDTDQYEVVCVSPRNHFIFTPMLPSTAVGVLG